MEWLAGSCPASLQQELCCPLLLGGLLWSASAAWLLPDLGGRVLGASLRTAALPSCCVSLLGTKKMSFVVGFICISGFFCVFVCLVLGGLLVVFFFFEKVSVTFHPSISVDPVNAAPTTSTRVFYISVGVCCAVIFLVAIILAVLHLHSMKRIELDDRYVFRLFQVHFWGTFTQIWRSSRLKMSTR